MTLTCLRIATAITVSLFLCFQTVSAQDLTPKSGIEITPDYSEEVIPNDLSLEEQANIFAKRQAKKLGLDDLQIMRLTIRRIAYLKKMEKITEETSNSSQEYIDMMKNHLDREFHSKFFELLNYEQRKKALEIINKESE